MSSTSQPLAGITVVSLEQAVAAPFATRQLADLGARVIKIERAEGDFARGYDDAVHGEASYFVWLNRGKESVVMDLKSEDDQALLWRILATADVFVQNLAPGAVDRLGFGAEAVRARHPRLIHASISGFGSGGPSTRRKAYDLIIQCESGLLSVTGTPETPSKVGVSIADIAAGMYTYSGILTALFQRERTGEGETLEVSMLEALGEWVSQTALFAEYAGRAPARTGGTHATIAPYGPHRVADGTVFFGLQNEREWATFCEQVLKRTELATDPRFTSNAKRVANREPLTELIEEVFARHGAGEIQELLDAAGIANARMRTMREFARHPQLAARDRWRSIRTPSGEARVLLPPANLASVEPVMGDVPALDADGDAVRTEFAAPSRDALLRDRTRLSASVTAGHPHRRHEPGEAAS